MQLYSNFEMLLNYSDIKNKTFCVCSHHHTFAISLNLKIKEGKDFG